jgi:hypothetical protein
VNWPWSKKKAHPDSPTTQHGTTIDRYAGKPLLRLLELYVLWALSRITQEDEGRLQAMAPKLTSLYGGDGSWQSALATAMHMPENMADLIREMWAKNQGIATANGVELLPQQFAEMFVDNNLT